MKTLTIIIMLVSLMLVSSLFAARKTVKIPSKAADFFENGIARQQVATTVETGKTIDAFIDGKWQTYNLVNFPPAFMKWNIDGRLEYMSQIREMMGGKEGAGPSLAGPHNGVVATYGYKGQKSQFPLNNAVKGMGFLPRADKIDSVLAMLKDTADAPMPQKLDILEGMYRNANNIFALDRQVSLELYSEPKFLTSSFTNQMVYPVSAVVFMDIPSYKFKAITRLLDPKDPELTPYEKKVVEYINVIHSYFHGEFDQLFIAVIYYATEVYDNSPGRMDARGLMIAP